MHDLRLLLRYLGPYRRDAVLGMLVVAVESMLELFIPLLMAQIIDTGIETGNVSLILRQGALMLGCALAALALGLGYARFASRASAGLGANLRDAAYAKIQTFSFGNLDRYQTSSLVTRLTTDVTVVQNAVTNGFRPMVRGPVMGIMALVYACVLNLELAGVFFALMPLLGVCLVLIVRRVAPRYAHLQASMDQLNATVQEDLTAIRAVKAYVREDHRRGVFGRVNGNLAQTATGTFGNAVLNVPAFQFFMYAAATLVLWFGGNMIVAGTLSVGELTGFMSYVLQIMNSLMMISNVFLLMTRALTSVRRISEVLDETPSLASPATGALTDVPNGAVEFRNVTFRYRADAEEDVLERVSLSIPSGATVGILGGTGSGKSSLVSLIPRLYDVSGGAVLVGGHDVRAYDLAALRDAVGIVLQKNVLFTGTVRDNLRWGNEEATDEELLRVCRLACVDEFLDRIGGLDGDLGQGGDNVSGGQKQRLCIARTLLKHPRVLIFDDSTSAVDMATDARIRENLASIPGTTVITIAQRITSVMGADMIFVLDDGRVHGSGTHEELLAHDRIYQEIYASQMEFAQAGEGGTARRAPDGVATVVAPAVPEPAPAAPAAPTAAVRPADRKGGGRHA